MHTGTRQFAAVGGIALLLAVSPNEGVGQAPSVRDSAGVSIVTIPGSGLPSFGIVSREPTLVLGAVSGGEATTFGTVSSAVRLRGGTIVVSDAQSHTIRFFDSGGNVQASAGGRGAGPGEFQSLAWIRRASDTTVIAYDRARRATVLDSRGRVLRSANVPGPPIGLFDNGELLVSRRNARAVERPPLGTGRDSSWYMLARDSSNWLAVDTLVALPNDDPPFSTVTRDPRNNAVVRISYGATMPFGRVSSAVTLPDGFVHTDGTNWELRFYSRTGDLIRLVHSERERRRVTDAHMRAFVRDFVARLRESARDGATRAFEAYQPPAYMPAIGVVKASSAGDLWVQEYPLPGATEHVWVVLDRVGMPRGEVRVPATIEVFDVGQDFVVGVRKGPYDIDQVVLFGIARE